jgi:hypothetical protein
MNSFRAVPAVSNKLRRGSLAFWPSSARRQFLHCPAGRHGHNGGGMIDDPAKPGDRTPTRRARGRGRQAARRNGLAAGRARRADQRVEEAARGLGGALT